MFGLISYLSSVKYVGLFNDDMSFHVRWIHPLLKKRDEKAGVVTLQWDINVEFSTHKQPKQQRGSIVVF